MGKTALVTGASGGIGKEICRSLACRGYNIVAVARTTEALIQLRRELQEKNGIKVLPISMDLTSEDAAAEIYNEVKRRNIRIDMLVNNAGFGGFGYYKDTAWSADHDMIKLNIVTLCALTKLFLPDMVSRRCGKILNIASTAAFAPGPEMSVYYASKSFVLSFSSALARECKGTGVTVTVLCPGPTATDFADRANLQRSRLYKFFAESSAASACDVAEYAVLKALEGKSMVIYGAANKLLYAVSKLAPQMLKTEIIFMTQKRK